MVQTAKGLADARPELRHVQLRLYGEHGRACPTSLPSSEAALARRDRGRDRRRCRACRSSSVANRWADASRLRSPRRAHEGIAGLVYLGTRCTRRENRSSAATRTCRRSSSRCCSCRERATRLARLTRFARCSRGSLAHRSTRLPAAITRSRSRAAARRSRCGTVLRDSRRRWSGRSRSMCPAAANAASSRAALPPLQPNARACRSASFFAIVRARIVAMEDLQLLLR